MSTVKHLSTVSQPSIRIIRRREVENLTGLSRSSIYQKMSKSSKYFDKDFPQSVALGANSVGWHLDQILKFIQSRPLSTQ